MQLYARHQKRWRSPVNEPKREHEPNPSNPAPNPRRCQQVCTHLLLKQFHTQRTRCQAAHEPLGAAIWETLTKLVPPQISIYYPWANPEEILRETSEQQSICPTGARTRHRRRGQCGIIPPARRRVQHNPVNNRTMGQALHVSYS